MQNSEKRSYFPTAEQSSELHDEACDRFSSKTTLILSLNAFLTALTLSFLISGLADATLLASWGNCLLCAVIFFMTSKKASQAIWKTLGLVLVISFFGYPIIPALIFGGIISTGAYSAIIATVKDRAIFLPALLPVSAYVISFAVSGDPLSSLVALIPFLPAIPMGLATRRKAGMTTAIALSSAVMLAVIAGCASLALWNVYGEVSMSAIDSAKRDITALFLEYAEEAFAQISEIEYNEALRKEFIIAIETYFNFAIGLAMALCSVAAFAAVRTQHALFRSHGIDHLVTPEMTTVTVSLAGAAVFAIAHVLSFSLDSSNELSMVGVVCGNICLALTPALALMGFQAVKELPQKLGGFGIILSIALVLAIVILTLSFPSFIAIVGAVYVVAMAVDSWAKKFYSKGDNK